jgi:hypothetical protein
MTRNRAQYNAVFTATYGEGPYACYFCGSEVSAEKNHIHHVNHDETDDRPKNLVATHNACHRSYHFRITWLVNYNEMMKTRKGHAGILHSEETKRHLSESHKAMGHAPTMEARSMGGKAPWTDERRANQSRAQSNRSPEWKEKNAAANRGSKRTPEQRQRMSDAAKARHARRRAEQAGGDANDD